MDTPIEFLSVGDITTDTFIRLKEATVQCDENNENCKISMSWGDKIPYEFQVKLSGVGNAANAAVSASRLGLHTGFLTYTGKDENGDGDIAAMKRDNVDQRYITQVEGTPANHDFVLWFGNERTILIKHSTFPYQIPTDQKPPKFVYLSSLGDPTTTAHHELVKWLATNPETKLFFNPGLEIGLGREKLEAVYAASYMCCCNKEEAARILGLDSAHDIKKLLLGMAAIGPKVVLISDGLNGAYGYDGINMYRIPLYPDVRGPYERTGAGDAFASTIAAALALGEPFEKALLWGPINSMSVVQKIGAQEGLLSRDELEKFLSDAPAEYALSNLE